MPPEASVAVAWYAIVPSYRLLMSRLADQVPPERVAVTGASVCAPSVAVTMTVTAPPAVPVTVALVLGSRCDRIGVTGQSDLAPTYP